MALVKLESPASKWLVGWSCGKETLKDGKYDTLKGSYYVNCASGFEEQQKTVAEKYPSFPEYTAPNSSVACRFWQRWRTSTRRHSRPSSPSRRTRW
jgi:hypothetical protein